MDREELVNKLAESLLWEVVVSYIEQCDQVPSMLEDIHYLKDKEDFLCKINSCEVFDSESFDVINFSVVNDKIQIEFECLFIMNACGDEDVLLRITGCAKGTCTIADTNVFDWAKIDFEDMNRLEILSYKNLVEKIDLHYTDVECDDVSFL